MEKKSICFKFNGELDVTISHVPGSRAIDLVFDSKDTKFSLDFEDIGDKTPLDFVADLEMQDVLGRLNAEGAIVSEQGFHNGCWWPLQEMLDNFYSGYNPDPFTDDPEESVDCAP